MPRFNFTQLLLSGKADITEVMDNFNKIEELGITATEVTEAINAATTNINSTINTKLNDYTKTEDLGALATSNYSYGKNAPSGGSSGDIYDQYFD